MSNSVKQFFKCSIHARIFPMIMHSSRYKTFILYMSEWWASFKKIYKCDFQCRITNTTRIFIISCLNHSPLSRYFLQYRVYASFHDIADSLSTSLHISNKPKFSLSNQLCVLTITFPITSQIVIISRYASRHICTK